LRSRASAKVASLGSGEMLGEISLVDESPPSATVVVVEPSHVLHVPRSTLNAKLDADSAFAARLYRAIAMFLSIRMRGTVQQLGLRQGLRSRARTKSTCRCSTP